jgi:hypothetical protein
MLQMKLAIWEWFSAGISSIVGEGRRLRARAKITSGFGARLPSPQSSPIGWEREYRAPRDCGSNRFGNYKRWVWLFPLSSDGRGAG